MKRKDSDTPDISTGPKKRLLNTMQSNNPALPKRMNLGGNNFNEVTSSVARKKVTMSKLIDYLSLPKITIEFRKI